VGHLDYPSSPEFRAAVSRAQWAVIQTGLITSGLALFGVYVLATRINDLHLMSMYLWNWIPFGPLLVGLIAGSGYILASWWFGVRVGPGMVLTIMLLQIGMFIACHYADFETRDLVYRETGQPVSFAAFFDRTTRRLGQEDLDPEDKAPMRGYAIRFAEAMCFAAGGLLSALTLVGRPKCSLCGGLVRGRSLGNIGGPRVGDVLKRLEEHARLSDVDAFTKDLDSAHLQANALELTVTRCEVCSVGAVEQSRTVGNSQETRASASSKGTMPWRIDVRGEFARQLFDRQPGVASLPPPPPPPSTGSVAGAGETDRL
jgi:hypothetical protein